MKDEGLDGENALRKVTRRKAKTNTHLMKKQATGVVCENEGGRPAKGAKIEKRDMGPENSLVCPPSNDRGGK